MNIYKTILKIFDKTLTKIFLGLIWIYQKTLSPDEGFFSPILKGKICSHEPHCSKYAKQVLKRYGFFRGLALISDRILSCKPSTKKMYDPAIYRIVFCCSANIGIPFLDELNSDKRFEICGIITQTDKPVGRGLKLQENPIKLHSKELFQDIDESFIQTPTKINPDKSIEGQNFYERLKNKDPDFLVVISYGKILPQSILDIAEFGSINVHGSLLPKYRGASPLQSIFLNKEQESGITIMHMDAGMDTGDIIDQLKFPIKFNRTVKELILALEQAGPKFLCDTLRNYGKHKIHTEKQKEDDATLCKKIEKADGEIQIYTDTIEEIYAKYRAYAIWPKIWFKLNGKSIILETLNLDEEKYIKNKDKLLFDGKFLNPAITNISLKPEGKKEMDWKSFSNGYIK